MHSLKIKVKSYVPENTFFEAKEAHVRRRAFSNCLVVNLVDGARIVAGLQASTPVGRSLFDVFSFSDENAKAFSGIFSDTKTPLLFPCQNGSLLAVGAWPRLQLALVFCLDEKMEIAQRAYQNAQRRAFSNEHTLGQQGCVNEEENAEKGICEILHYVRHLFGEECEKGVAAQVLMIANLMGCRLHEISATCARLRVSDWDLQRMGAYLTCVFMTLRRFGGNVGVFEENADEKAVFSTHAPQQAYGLCIEQNTQRLHTEKNNARPSTELFESFATLPCFSDLEIETKEEGFTLHLPLYRGGPLGAVPFMGRARTLSFTFFPIFAQK